MKTRYTFLTWALAVTSVAMAQESDDMYFNSKDRLALTENNQSMLVSRYQENDKQAVKASPVNPSDSYTGRGVNPEFSAQQKNGTTVVEENPDYFLAGYQPKNINSNQYSSNLPSYNNCNCGFNNPYGFGRGGFGSPYGNYGNFYSPYGMGFSPYGYSGMNSMMGFGYGYGNYGSMFTMGMGYGMGMGSMFYNPYMYNNYAYGYPGTVYVPVGVDNMGQAYGKRTSRSSSVNYYSGSGAVAGTSGRSRVDGRARTTQSNYYDPTWRSNANNFSSRSATDYGSRSSSYQGTSGRGWNTDPGRTRSSFDSFGSGSRGTFSAPSGGSSSGSSSSGRSRGRN